MSHIRCQARDGKGTDEHIVMNGEIKEPKGGSTKQANLLSLNALKGLGLIEGSHWTTIKYHSWAFDLKEIT